MFQKNRMLPKILFSCWFFILLGANGFGQVQSIQSGFWDRVSYGGGIGVGFNNAGFNGSIAPSAIYGFSERFSAGVALNVIYSKAGDNKLFAYGGGLVGLYSPLDFLQISAELEQLRVNRELRTNLGVVDVADWVPSLYLGLGYRNQNFTVGIRYDLLYDDEKSIYVNPWAPFVRFYF